MFFKVLLKMKRLIPFFAIIIGLTQTSCYINNDLMLKTNHEYVFDSIPKDPTSVYRLAPNDILELRIYANDGFLIIDISSGTSESNRTNQQVGRNFITYLIEDNGEVKLPMLDYVSLSGLTIKEAQDKLEELYAEFYINPYVQLNVVNKRVIVFPGSGGSAQVIQLTNNNTTLIETIAKSGGITPRGKAKRIKLIRQEDSLRKVYLIDLSTIEGIKHADLVVQANDIIYIEPVPQIAREILQEVTPVVQLLSSVFLIYVTLNQLK